MEDVQSPQPEVRMFKRLSREIADIAEEKGFWRNGGQPDLMIPIKIALMHSELSEALEVHRESAGKDLASAAGMPWGEEKRFCEELADTVIRILDTVGYYRLEHIFATEMMAKIDKNRSRPYLHGKGY